MVNSKYQTFYVICLSGIFTCFYEFYDNGCGFTQILQVSLRINFDYKS